MSRYSERTHSSLRSCIHLTSTNGLASVLSAMARVTPTALRPSSGFHVVTKLPGAYFSAVRRNAKVGVGSLLRSPDVRQDAQSDESDHENGEGGGEKRDHARPFQPIEVTGGEFDCPFHLQQVPVAGEQQGGRSATGAVSGGGLGLFKREAVDEVIVGGW